MERYVVRVWLPDRPGALGLVASRIGAVRAEIIGIEILEHGAGRAIDELVVELPDPTLLKLLVDEVNTVDGVDVEDVRPAPATLRDPRVDALETVATLVELSSDDEMLSALVAHVRVDFEGDWAAVIGRDGPGVAASLGPVPSAAWLQAFLDGSRSSATTTAGALRDPDDMAWAPLAGVGLDLVLGRHGRPLRDRERRQLMALGRIVGARLRQLGVVPSVGVTGP
ncbi:MAG TPA: hypothetical protein VK975_03765 [Acidimicrobiales bacterium]|nr:hypothetical protein [Acidimicrobiales bacterium]